MDAPNPNLEVIECEVCCEEFSKAYKLVSCACGIKICNTCVKPHCMSCRGRYCPICKLYRTADEKMLNYGLYTHYCYKCVEENDVHYNKIQLIKNRNIQQQMNKKL